MKVAIVSFRISGNDGVSLEAVHWKKILKRLGHKVTFIAGELDRGGYLMPELSFKWPKVTHIYNDIVYNKAKYKHIEREIYDYAGTIEGKLREYFSNGGRPDLLIIANMLSLPMHFPASVAITRVIEDYKLPTIARHHDFWWERKRFLRSSMFPYFKKWFPPKLSNLKHVVINSIAQRQLEKRAGISAEIISDSFDFNSSFNKLDSYSAGLRSEFAINKDDIVFLQATRIVPRKRVEISIDLIKKLNNPKIVLVVAGKGGDEGEGYERTVRVYAGQSKIKCLFLGHRINSKRKIVGGKKIYTLWDCYVNSDFVIYPTEKEGFGNQFVETMYFKKSLILTPYQVYKSDIKSLGFEVIEISSKISKNAIKSINRLIDSPMDYKRLVERNFELGRKYFSYEVAGRKLKKLL